MMVDWSSLSHEDLKILIQNTAKKKKIQETVVEKDYWVCFVLDYLFHQCKWKDVFTFKGGTSLSKCFSLIHRFSEDIDLILDWRLLGYDKEEPWLDRSKTKQERFNKGAGEKTKEFLEKEFIQEMEKDFTKLLGDNFEIDIDEKDPQTILFYYPKVFASSYLSETIRMEIGSLAAWTPWELSWIEPYIATEYPQVFKGQKVQVRVVSPERTFWEKATILHHEANRPKESKLPDHYARHYYDVYCMAKSDYKEKAFDAIHLLKKVAEFKQKFYPRAWAKYEEATKDHIRLVPDPYRQEELKADYGEMEEMFMGKIPDFEEVMETIEILEEEIHKL